MRTLLIDNHDSFTYNLFPLLAAVNGEEPLVVRNDEATWEQLAAEPFDNVVISPGPGRPERPRDVGLSADAVRGCRRPLLGVCLGHQAIGHAFGARVVRAPEPVHGRPTKVHHLGDALFAGIGDPFTAVRYHSLCVVDLPSTLEAIAWSDDAVVMGLRHRERPLWGVQFHPESICSDAGAQLLANFRALTEQHAAQPRRNSRTSRTSRNSPTSPAPRTPAARAGARRPSTLVLRTREVPEAPGTEQAFTALYGDARSAFWLDSAAPADARSRFSYMGDASGPLAETLTYDLGRRRLTVSAQERTATYHESIFDHLDRELGRRRIAEPGLPFGLPAGYVGYLGYELKADCGATSGPEAPTPDAGLIFADRVLVFDHARATVTLCALAEAGEEAAADAWIERTAARLALLGGQPAEAADGESVAADTEVVYRHRPERYRELVRRCLAQIAAGESYELCLTNTATVSSSADPLELYRVLRRVNPAPYGAFLRLPGVSVLSSSPERFLAVDDRVVETRPIKGTRRRVACAEADEAVRAELANCEKDLAENLMIVDLARNDLGRVCEPGSVEVPELFGVETYETVHQLVSTVRGRLCEDRSPIDAVRAAFPPGSMTGAPKQRSMEILDRLEGGPRGPYGGALGFFGLTGAIDLSVVIRTLVADRDGLSFGVGGAIVALSDPDAELDECLLKAEPLVRSLRVAAQGSYRGTMIGAGGGT